MCFLHAAADRRYSKERKNIERNMQERIISAFAMNVFTSQYANEFLEFVSSSEKGETAL